jgi:hypothetical protein
MNSSSWLAHVCSFSWDDVTVAVWIGYDNPDGKRRTLGGGEGD